VWFLSPYASFAEMESAIKEKEYELLKNGSNQAPVARATSSTWIALYRADLSYQPQKMELGKNRFLRVYQVRSGKSYQAVAEGKSLVAAYENAGVDTAFVCYEVVSGGLPGTLIFFEGMRSLAKLDSMNERWSAVTDALGAEKMNRIEEGLDRVYSSIEDILFAVRPEISRVTKETMESDPAFWNAQAVTADWSLH